MVEFNKKNVEIYNVEVDDCDTVRAVLELYMEWSDIDEKFGTDTEKNEDEYVDVYASYCPDFDELTVDCFLDKDGYAYYFSSYAPKGEEKIALEDLIEDYVKEHYDGKSVSEMLAEYKMDVEENKHDKT